MNFNCSDLNMLKHLSRTQSILGPAASDATGTCRVHYPNTQSHLPLALQQEDAAVTDTGNHEAVSKQKREKGRTTASRCQV